MRRFFSIFLPLVFLPMVTRAELPVAKLDREKPVDFATEVYPFLRANCLACHNSTKAKANLILESPQDMLRGGDTGPALEPGDAEFSLLFTTSAHIEEPVMPPANNKSKARNLNPVELALLKRWIDEGGKGEKVGPAAPESWQVLTGPQPILSSALTGDGRFAAVGRGQRIDVYDLRLGRLAGSLVDPGLEQATAHRDRVQALAFGRDGLLASGGFRSVKIWRRAPATRDVVLEATSPVTAFDVSRDGSRLAAALEDGSILVGAFDGAHPVETPTAFKAGKGEVLDIAFSFDGKDIYATTAGQVLIRQDLGGENRGRLDLSHPAGHLVLIDEGRHLLLDFGEGRFGIYRADLEPVAGDVPFHPIQLESQPVVFMGTVGDEGSEVVIGFANGFIDHVRFDSSNLANAPVTVRRIHHEGPVGEVAVSPDGSRLASAGKTGAVKLWNLGDGKLIAELRDDPYLRQREADLERKQTVAGRVKAHWDKLVPEEEKLWKAETENAFRAGETIAKTRGLIREKKREWERLQSDPGDEGGEALEAALSDLVDARRILERQIRSRDTSAKLAGEAYGRYVAALSAAAEAEANGKVLAGELQALAKAIGESATSLAIDSLGFSRDGSLLAGSLKGGGVRLWASGDGAWLEDVRGVGGGALVCLPDNRSFLATDGAKVTFSTLPGGEWSLERQLGDGSSDDPFSGRVFALDFSDEGDWLAAGSGVPSRSGDLALFETANWTLAARNEEAHRDTVNTVAFSPDGKWLASGGADRFVRTFEVEGLLPAQSFEGHQGHVLDVAWSPDQLFLSSAASDAEVKTWNRLENEEESKVTTFRKEVVAVEYVGGSGDLLTAAGDESLMVAGRPVSGGGKTFLHTAQIDAEGSVVIAGGEDGALRVWDGKTRQLKFEFSAGKESKR